MSLLAALRSLGRLVANRTVVNASLYLGERLSAGLLAGATGFRTDPAMGVHLRMASAFLTAGGAGPHAGFNDRLQHLQIPPRAADGGLTGGKADIGAILVQPDALAKLRHHVLGEAGIGAGNAGLCAVEARLDAGDQQVIGAALHLRVGLDHGSDGHRSHLLSAVAPASRNHIRRRVFPPDRGMQDPGAVKKTFR